MNDHPHPHKELETGEAERLSEDPNHQAKEKAFRLAVARRFYAYGQDTKQMTWYAFTVPPQLERHAWDGLEKIHIEPARLEFPRPYRGRDGRRRIIMRPLLPGYAIGNVSGAIPWPLIRMIEWQGKPIIRDVLRSGATPTAIPADEIERLAAYLEESEQAGPGFIRPGARARVSIGRHDDRETVIRRVLSESKCTVMMRLFNSEREVQTTVERLREAG